MSIQEDKGSIFSGQQYFFLQKKRGKEPLSFFICNFATVLSLMAVISFEKDGAAGWSATY
jgi:hypothetical protein